MQRRPDEDDGGTEDADARWAALDRDLAGRAAAREAAALAADAAELSRAELGRLGLGDRLRAHLGASVAVDVLGAGRLGGRLQAVGPDVVVLAVASPAGQVVVPLPAVVAVAGAGSRATAPEAVPRVDRVLGLAHVLRRLVRDRRRLQLVTVDGAVRTGTLDVVAADHVELAEHPLDVPRRRTAVTGHRLVALRALAAVTVRD